MVTMYDLVTAPRILERLRAPRPDELIVHESIDLWRVYLLHRGRLCPPFVDALSPVDRVTRFVCSKQYAEENAPESVIFLQQCVDVPGEGCICGLRAVDNMHALAPVVNMMVNATALLGPVARCIEAESGRSIPFDLRRSEEQIAYSVQLDTFDLPVPALVRVRARAVRRDDSEARIADWYRETGAREIHGAAHEWYGTYRAAELEIIGPVLVGATQYGSPDPRDLEQHYGVQYLDMRSLGLPQGPHFGSAMQAVTDGVLPVEPG